MLRRSAVGYFARLVESTFVASGWRRRMEIFSTWNIPKLRGHQCRRVRRWYSSFMDWKAARIRDTAFSLPGRWQPGGSDPSDSISGPAEEK